jgi:hypothetical protein
MVSSILGDAFQRLDGGAFGNLAVRCEPGTVTRAVPRPFTIIPLNLTA